MKKTWWMSSEKMTVLVTCQDGIVVDGPPIVRKFVGQSASALYEWMSKQGGMAAVCLEERTWKS
jgi:hypothetical protein